MVFEFIISGKEDVLAVIVGNKVVRDLTCSKLTCNYRHFGLVNSNYVITIDYIFVIPNSYHLPANWKRDQ